MAPSRSLPRCASELADPPSPFSSNPAHHPVSMPTTPAGVTSSSSSSFGCMAGKPSATDSPPATPGRSKLGNKPLTPGAAAVAAYYASQWSPRRLMQRAARAFRTSRSRRVRVSSPVAAASSPTTGKASAIGGGVELAAVSDGHVQREEENEERHEHEHPDAVPEKIIHEMKRHSPAVVKEDGDECGVEKTPAVEGKETAALAAGEDEEEVVESPKKGETVMTPPPAAEVVDVVVPGAGEEVVAEEKLVAVVKEAIKKHEAAEHQKGAAVRNKFQSRVKTAMEARPEARGSSNDVIEEARSMLLEKRQLSKVRALVGAFETVMDNTSKDAAAAATPRMLRNLSRRSA
ncbi:hypothetical protein HU200_043954 [Digitaria exilis]|uniref:Calmodulin-binding domain-containing protein n=1 Tax=Digitaria exilis TaxID=1010633 RepID=A0A835B2P8_9POAL|nr:hypothetical protein HU200_043954 [Digitaria exilis]